MELVTRPAKVYLRYFLLFFAISYIWYLKNLPTDQPHGTPNTAYENGTIAGWALANAAFATFVVMVIFAVFKVIYNDYKSRRIYKESEIQKSPKFLLSFWLKWTAWATVLIYLIWIWNQAWNK